jgi:hypothetical protein
MAVVNALVDGVAGASGPLALERLARRERLMQQWDAFLLRPDAPSEE